LKTYKFTSGSRFGADAQKVGEELDKLMTERDGKLATEEIVAAASDDSTELNRCFTRLVTAFTRCRYPQTPTFLSDARRGRAGAFDQVDEFAVGRLRFAVLESRGGHIPGQVFLLEPAHGLLFTGDYLLNVASLSAEDRERLSVPRYLMTSTNTDSGLFREESRCLRELALEVDAELKGKGGSLLILPGHGLWYPAEALAGE